MKKQGKIELFTIILFLIFITSCYKGSYKLGYSNNISESKERNVFIKELKYNITDSLMSDYYFEFSEAFLEKSWKYGSSFEKTILKDEELLNKYRIILSYKHKYIKPSYCNIFFEANTIQKNIRLFVSNQGSMVSWVFDSYFITDTIRFNIINENSKNKIGELVLTHKIL